MIGFIQDWGSIILSVISIFLAVVSLIKSSKVQKLQPKLNELELELKKYAIEKINMEKEQLKKTCVEARIIAVASNKHKIKVWNSGNTLANDVEIEIDENAGIIILENIFPYEELDIGKSFDVAIITHYGSARKFYITTKWKDAEGLSQSKRQLVSL